VWPGRNLPVCMLASFWLGLLFEPEDGMKYITPKCLADCTELHLLPSSNSSVSVAHDPCSKAATRQVGHEFQHFENQNDKYRVDNFHPLDHVSVLMNLAQINIIHFCKIQFNIIP
jgi:hypothetical protein